MSRESQERVGPQGFGEHAFPYLALRKQYWRRRLHDCPGPFYGAGLMRPDESQAESGLIELIDRVHELRGTAFPGSLIFALHRSNRRKNTERSP
jgi:hypothetical protein